MRLLIESQVYEPKNDKKKKTDMQSASLTTGNVADFDAKKQTCPDCFDLSIFNADNSTMHMDQIQWK